MYALQCFSSFVAYLHIIGYRLFRWCFIRKMNSLVDWLAMSRYNYGRRVTYSLLMLQIDRESEMAAKTMLILLLAVALAGKASV